MAGSRWHRYSRRCTKYVIFKIPEIIAYFESMYGVANQAILYLTGTHQVWNGVKPNAI